MWSGSWRQRKGGPEYAYRLTIAPSRPDFDLEVQADHPPRLLPGETAVVTVTAIRRSGFDGEIRLTLKKPPGFVLRGGTIPKKQGGGVDNIPVTITAPAGAAAGGGGPGDRRGGAEQGSRSGPYGGRGDADEAGVSGQCGVPRGHR